METCIAELTEQADTSERPYCIPAQTPLYNAFDIGHWYRIVVNLDL